MLAGWKAYTGAAIVATNGILRLVSAPVWRPEDIAEVLESIGVALGIVGIRAKQSRLGGHRS